MADPDARMKTSTKTLLALTAAAAFGGFAATAIRDAVQAPAQAAMPVAAAPVPAVAALPAAIDGEALPSLAPMLKRVTPSVVSVQTAQRQQVSPFGNDPFFRRMFPELSQERIARSLGSGVIIDAAQGYVLTNHHVIEGADEVTVWPTPNGLPTATTKSPTCSLPLSASGIATRSLAGIRISATSVSASEPRNSALSVRPSARVTDTSSAPSTTWWLVST